MRFVLLSIFFSFSLLGCSDFESPSKGLNVESIVGGGPSLRKGMTKDEILEKWGNPDDKKYVGESRWGAPIERWTYYAWFPSMPVDYRYVSKGRHLFFEGDALVRWEEVEFKQKKINPDAVSEEKPQTAEALDSKAIPIQNNISKMPNKL